MHRRDFLKHSALAGATAALSSSLSASVLGSDAEAKKIALVSESARETDYIGALGRSGNVDRIVALGSDRLENFKTIAAVMEEARGAVVFGILEHGDYVLLQQASAASGARWISETAHMPVEGGVRHSETSNAKMPLKKAFERLDPSAGESYGPILSSFHAIGSHRSVAEAQESGFVSAHAAKNPFVSFVIKV